MLASAGTDRQSGRMPPEREALLVTGIYGSGKTSLVEELADRYERLGVAFGAIDLDWLGWYQLPDGSGVAPQPDLQLENLTDVAGRYWRSGVRYLLLAGAARDDADVQRIRVGSAVPPPSGPARHPDRRRRATPHSRSRPVDAPHDLAVARDWVSQGLGQVSADLTLPGDAPLATLGRAGADLARLAACQVADLSDPPCMVRPWTRRRHSCCSLCSACSSGPPLGALLMWRLLRRPPGAVHSGADAVPPEQLLRPVNEALGRVERQLAETERHRLQSHGQIQEQVRAMNDTSQLLRTETSSLVQALRAPQTRGRWGEIQLRRVVELAGLVEHCDFTEQLSVGRSDDRQRPDLVVHLAGGKNVVVDAKVPFAAYLEASAAADEATAAGRSAAHARHLRTHIDELASREYWEALAPSPEFVVLFVPAEPFLSAALDDDPALLEHAFTRQVVIATPNTLVALLRTVAYTWRQDALADNAQAVLAAGRELHQRLGVARWTPGQDGLVAGGEREGVQPGDRVAGVPRAGDRPPLPRPEGRRRVGQSRRTRSTWLLGCRRRPS